MKFSTCKIISWVTHSLKRQQAGQPMRTQLLITPEILLKIYQQWREQDTEWDIICFYYYLGAGRAVIPSNGGFDPPQYMLANYKQA